jgi:hypothetical protein
MLEKGGLNSQIIWMPRKYLDKLVGGKIVVC